ncbi:hypothetical protein D3C72_2025100 [compost metagenome]
MRTLVQKGLLAKTAEQPKGRAELLKLTDAGRAMLEQDPTQAVEAVINELGASERECFARSLELILGRLSEMRHANPS